MSGGGEEGLVVPQPVVPRSMGRDGRCPGRTLLAEEKSWV